MREVYEWRSSFEGNRIEWRGVNLIAGSIYDVKWYIDGENFNEELRLEWVIARYNLGYTGLISIYAAWSVPNSNAIDTIKVIDCWRITDLAPVTEVEG